jgi:hypothetical protein
VVPHRPGAGCQWSAFGAQHRRFGAQLRGLANSVVHRVLHKRVHRPWDRRALPPVDLVAQPVAER